MLALCNVRNYVTFVESSDPEGGPQGSRELWLEMGTQELTVEMA